MFWLTVSNAFDESINTPNVYLFSLEESYIILYYIILYYIILGQARVSDFF